MPEHKDIQVDDILLRERTVAAVTRLYPLNSGCGRLATSTLVNAIAGQRSATVWTQVFGRSALVPLSDLVGRAMFFVGDLDPKVTWAVRNHVAPGDTVLDIGANLGLMTLLMAGLVGADGKVHAFEPNPNMIALLEKTFAANSELNITLHSIGLGNQEDELTLSIPAGNIGAATLLNDVGRRIAKTYNVPVKPLSSYCDARGIDRIDFIKLDVEGFEAEVLEGGLDVLRRYKPRAILFEANDYKPGGHLPRSFELLGDLGYRIRAIPKNLLVNQLVELDDPRAATAHDFLAVAS